MASQSSFPESVQPAGGGFDRRFRLLQPAEFDAVFRAARRSADRWFTVLYRANDLGHPRLGLVIQKKRARRAVDRNRLKRLIRESFRRAKGQLSCVDIVIMARDPASAASNDELANSLAAHWRVLVRPQRTQ